MNRAQRIETIVEQMQPAPAPISDAQMLATVRRALASAQSRAYAAERQVQRLEAELAAVRALAEKAKVSRDAYLFAPLSGATP